MPAGLGEIDGVTDAGRLSELVRLLVSEFVGVIESESESESVGVGLAGREPVGLGDRELVGLGERDPVVLADRDPMGLGDRDPVGLTDRDLDELADREPVGLTVIDPVGLGDREREPVGENDKGISAYEIENTGLPPAPAIGTAVGKTIVRVEFCETMRPVPVKSRYCH